MVSVLALWLPILVSAVLVFVASSIIHMFLGYHGNDFKKAPAEDETMGALRSVDLPPGEYVLPHAGSMKAMSDPAYIEKQKRGPVALVTVIPSGPPSMGSQLGLWFVYLLVAGALIAYIAGLALPPGAEYAPVFHFIAPVAFVAYAVGLWQDSIWFHRSWSTTAKNTLDGMIYALLTAGTFGWLWPGA